MSEPRVSTCSTCLFSWETGRNGSHSCAEVLAKRLVPAWVPDSYAITRDSWLRALREGATLADFCGVFEAGRPSIVVGS